MQPTAKTMHTAIRDRATALRCFFDILDNHSERIEATRRKVSDIYAFRTPATPYFEYCVAGTNTSVVTPFEYEQSAWVRTQEDRRLDGALQQIAYRLGYLPMSDYVPGIHPGHGNSDLIPRLYGCDFDTTPEGAVINKNYRILDLAAEIDDFLAEEIPLENHPLVFNQVEFTKYAAEMVEGRVQIVYPQMQGPLTNAMRLMEQSEMLIACATDKPNLRRLCEKITDHMIGIIRLLRRAAGSPDAIRPRGRFYQPPGIVGLVVDDYISVIGPGDYLEICGSSWQKMHDALGPIYLHTCGPVGQALEMMKELPGLKAFETAFVDGQCTTTRGIEEAKRKLAGKIVMGTFGLPHGEPVQDEANLTRAWLDSMSRCGGYMMHASGSYEYGKALFEKLEIG